MLVLNMAIANANRVFLDGIPVRGHTPIKLRLGKAPGRINDNCVPVSSRHVTGGGNATDLATKHFLDDNRHGSAVVDSHPPPVCCGCGFEKRSPTALH